jgi:putative addiction module killer protein
MIEIRQTPAFSQWRVSLNDHRVRVAIAKRLLRIQSGNFGDAKYLGGDVAELRFDLGSGYRVYFHRRGNVVVVLLCGGDKSTQRADIKEAKSMIAELEL